jgi:poly(A) polymerase
VRDLLIGGHPKDFDVATNATPEQVQGAVPQLPADRPALPHRARGVRPRDHRGGDLPLQRGRRQRLARDGRRGPHPPRQRLRHIEHDAVRRDFTANALYYTVDDFSVRDYVGGFEDVQARVLKLIGEPGDALPRGPGAHAARGAPGGEARTSRSTRPRPSRSRAWPGLLSGAAPARLFDECLKMFLSGHAEKSFLGLERTACCRRCSPETAKALATNAAARCGTTCCRRCATPMRASPPTSRSRPPSCSRRCCGRPTARAGGAAEGRRRSGDRAAARRRPRHPAPGRAHRAAARFSLPMQEIWLLQPRFTSACASACSACSRIRASAPPSIPRAALARQSGDRRRRRVLARGAGRPEARRRMLEAARAEEAQGPEGGPPPRRRRRRRRSGGGNAGEPHAQAASLPE